MEENNVKTIEEVPIKDPKRVAAGKLARKNVEARKQQKVVQKGAAATQEIETSEEKLKTLTFSDLSFGIQSAAGIVGAGFVLYNGWYFISPHINKLFSGE